MTARAWSLKRDKLGRIEETGRSILHEVHLSVKISGEKQQIHKMLPPDQLRKLTVADDCE